MKHIVISVLAALMSGHALVEAKETILEEFSWRTLAQNGQLKAGNIIQSSGDVEALKIENPSPEALQVTLFTVEKPKITTDFYKLSGDVRYENVSGTGFLEMWNHFAGNAYFTRTMGGLGPMGKLEGTSDWRPFILPFNATGAKSRPDKLVVNIHLPGRGTVYLRNLKLMQSSDVGAVYSQPGAWWSDRTAGLIGAICGVFVGCLGSLMELLAKKGKSQRFVLSGCRALIGIGAAGTGLGLFALLSHQPYGVWYVLLLIGVLCVLIFPFRLRRYQELYRALELRRMAAIDAS